MKIAIAGYGVEGVSNYRYYAADLTNEITIVDQRQPSLDIPTGVLTIIGQDALDNLVGFDLVVRTAGLDPSKIKTDGKIWSATNEFFAKCPAPIIGVTGSKGKGTTASLIASILREAGKKVWLVGNIGVAALDVLADIKSEDIVVYELSSFQLWDIQASPHIAVVLFIEQEHLDVHDGMQDYVNAKARITHYQTSQDILVYNQTNQYAKTIAQHSSAQTIPYPDVSAAHIRDGSFYQAEQLICSVDALQIIGRHNQDNACAAIEAVWSLTNDREVIEKGFRSFTGLPHRLKFVREIEGVRYYDDSIATTPSSAIAALRAFDEPKVIILGGSSKGSDFSELATELTHHKVRAILIGAEAEKIAASCRKTGFTDFEIMVNPTAQTIVQRAHSVAHSGSVVLLSPASASFGLFKNYIDRGEQFVDAVEAL
ncbi:UDP-N-acetylmuramoyl-L-alanine--D-glutamate ligase [Candidatus Saccharibacteria bacterium]|nr:UDP-N-acetylmuramoyl-L-alanine--D-glutamate ligase [Candidatus Saccharibacteria bacterium]